MAKMYVSDEVFCRAVVDAVKNGEGAAEVASSLGLKEATVKTRANALRKANVPLPKFKQARQKTDLEALAKMVDAYMKEEDEKTTEETTTEAKVN